MLASSTPNIFQAVRQGDIETVRYLVEVQAEPLQQHDEWDATPLYYAAYAGNKDLVSYLLSTGAKCEEKTFDGERCLYAALNDETRHLLLDQGFQRAGARGHDLFLDFIGKAFNVPEAYPDLIATIGDEQVLVHKFMLAARAPAIGKLFASSWQQSPTTYTETDPNQQAPLQALLRWFYTSRLELPYEAVPACLQLLQLVGLTELADEANAIVNSEAGRTLQLLPFRGSSLVVEPMRDVAKQQMQDCLEQVIAVGCAGLNMDDATLSAEHTQQQKALFFDLKLVLGPGSSCLCHKSFMSRRSDYFCTMLGSSFQEGADAASSDMLEIQIADAEPAVVHAALRWVYTDRVDADMLAEQLLQVMQYADQALMEGLKGRCAMLLHPHVTKATALPLLQQALAMDSDRLTETCVRCIAQHLLELVVDPLFGQLVKESAETVQNREDVDSVPIIDDIRYHVTLLHGDGELSDDGSDDDVLDPAQLAFIATETQPAAQQQQQHRAPPHHLYSQQPQQHWPQQQQPQQQQAQPQLLTATMSAHATPAADEHNFLAAVSDTQQTGQKREQPDATPRPVEHGHLCFDDSSNEEADEAEEELICMDDPRFATLSERRQKLMALEEVLLNTGIDG